MATYLYHYHHPSAICHHGHRSMLAPRHRPHRHELPQALDVIATHDRVGRPPLAAGHSIRLLDRGLLYIRLLCVQEGSGECGQRHPATQKTETPHAAGEGRLVTLFLWSCHSLVKRGSSTQPNVASHPPPPSARRAPSLVFPPICVITIARVCAHTLCTLHVGTDLSAVSRLHCRSDLAGGG